MLIIGLAVSACAAQTPRKSPAVSAALPSSQACGQASAFKPSDSVRKVGIDYSTVDELLGVIVFDGGPSLRRRASRPRPPTGTHLTYGHDSAVRLEGNKVIFSQFDDSHRTRIKEELAYLIGIGEQVDVTTLPRSEQLAYWFNLHNLLVISTITDHYPIRRPSRIEPQPGLGFHQAPLVTIKDTALSLQDIRSCIVYRHWRDPRVVYGFFHGELSSPRIPPRAWKAETVYDELDYNANEFVNSLRGVSRSGNRMLVSAVYAEAKPQLFPDWTTDLREHLRQFAQLGVQKILNETANIDIGHQARRTADLAGGQINRPPFAEEPVPGLPPSVGRAVLEIIEKEEELRLRKLRTTVEIIDVDSDKTEEDN